MCVCACVCMLCVYACVCYVCMHMCIWYVFVCVSVCACMCVYTRTHVCVCAFWHVNIIVISVEISDQLLGVSSFLLPWIPGIIQVFRLVGQMLLPAEISCQPLKTF